MGNTESLPVVSQARSAWQAIAGDLEGARRTQKNFFRGCPVFSQLTSLVQASQGDTKAAKDTQKYFAKNLFAAADSIPAVGHIKGGIHYVCGDKKGGDSAMIAASRTTGVIAGGIAGGLVGGPVGAFAGGVAGGAAMDGITTAVDSAVKGEFSPHGHIALGKMADNGTMDAGAAFDWAMMPLCDGLAGKAHSKVYQRSRFVVKKNISSTGSKVRVSGLKKLAKYQTLPPPPAKHQKNKEEHVSDNPKVVEPLMKNPLTMKQIMKNPLMKNIDPKMVESILNEEHDEGSVDWDDIAGLPGVKNIIKEIILKPMLRPDIFTGLRTPAKGILLFGPPGTGKTMIGRLIASRSKSCFFNISASSLTSKWVGDGEKMVRALFAVARAKQPAVVFIDEIDSILTKRSDNDHEASRRLKTEFFMQFDGCGSKSEDRILIIGVTNRPRELDDAARRRFVKRIYIPLPDSQGRKQLVKNLIKSQKTSIGETEFDKIADMTEGYSGADMATLCQEAAYGPIRDDDVDIENISLEDVRPINLHDFGTALDLVKPSVDPTDLAMYEEFDRKFGCKVVKPKVRAV